MHSSRSQCNLKQADLRIPTKTPSAKSAEGVDYKSEVESKLY
jgi:hypothetical protein